MVADGCCFPPLSDIVSLKSTMPPLAEEMRNDIMQPVLEEGEIKGMACKSIQLLDARFVDVLCYVEFATCSSLGKTTACPVFFVRHITDRERVP